MRLSVYAVAFQCRCAKAAAKRLCCSITGPRSTVATRDSRTTTLPSITLNATLDGAQNTSAATGSCKAPAKSGVRRSNATKSAADAFFKR